MGDQPDERVLVSPRCFRLRPLEVADAVGHFGERPTSDAAEAVGYAGVTRCHRLLVPCCLIPATILEKAIGLRCTLELLQQRQMPHRWGTGRGFHITYESGDSTRIVTACPEVARRRG